MNQMTNAVRLLLLLSCMSFCQGDETPAEATPTLQPTQLQPVFSEDFSKDTRADYTVTGDVSWESGKLTLAEGASIERTVQAGTWGRVAISFNELMEGVNNGAVHFNVHVFVHDSIACTVHVSLTKGTNEPIEGTARLVQSSRAGNLTSESLVREMPFKIDRISEFIVQYRYGLVQAFAGDKTLLTSHVHHGPATINGLRIEAASGSVELAKWSFVTTALPEELTSEQELQLTEANRIEQQLFAQFRDGRYREALAAGERVCRIRRNILGVHHPEYAASLNNLAGIARTLGDHGRAESLYQEALSIARMTMGVQHPAYGAGLGNLAELYLVIGDYARAEPLLLESMAIKKNAFGEQNAAYALGLGNLANLYSEMGNLKEAERLHRKSIEIRSATLGEEHEEFATGLMNLANVYSKMGQTPLAEKLLERAIEIQKLTIGEQHNAYAATLNSLASVYMENGDYSHAESLYLDSLRIRKAAIGESSPDYATALNNLAVLYLNSRDYLRARAEFKKALEIQKTLLREQNADYATTLHNLAIVDFELGELESAVRLLRQSLEIKKARVGEQHEDYASPLHNLALMLLVAGQREEAESLLKRSLEIRKAVLGEKHPVYASCLNNLAGIFEEAGDYNEAERLFCESHETMQDVARNTLPTLPEAKAWSWIRSNAPRTDLVLSILRRQQAWHSNRAYSSVWDSKALVSRLRVGQTRPSERYGDAQATFDQLRDVRLRLASLVSLKPAPEVSPRYFEALKQTNLLKERLEKQLAEINPASGRELRIRNARVADLLLRLPEGVAVIDFVRLFAFELAERTDSESETGSPADLSSKLRTQAPLFYDAFVLRSDRPSAPAGATWIPIGVAEPIDAAIRQWRLQLTRETTTLSPEHKVNEIGTDGRNVIADPAARLRQLLWDRLEPELAGCHTVILMPDGDLNRLPWAALPGRQQDTFLLEDYAIGTAGYGQQLFGLLSNDKITGAPRLLVAGGISYDRKPDSDPQHSDIGNQQLMVSAGSLIERAENDSQWSYLPGAQREAHQIAEIWGELGELTSLGEARASEETVSNLLPTSRYVHLATHGFFDWSTNDSRVNLREQTLFPGTHRENQHAASVADRNPLLMTGIVLSGANLPPQTDNYGLPIGGDGILTAEEIEGIDLRNTELVTLSACETALGDVAAGEGVFGLSRALHNAGVRTVLSSLWKVDDAATVALMTEFYINLWQKKMSKAEALRQAQLAMIRDYDPKSNTLRRGLGTKPEKVAAGTEPGAAEPEAGKSLLDPALWAAFQLSGDWR